MRDSGVNMDHHYIFSYFSIRMTKRISIHIRVSQGQDYNSQVVGIGLLNNTRLKLDQGRRMVKQCVIGPAAAVTRTGLGTKMEQIKNECRPKP